MRNVGKHDSVVLQSFRYLIEDLSDPAILLDRDLGLLAHSSSLPLFAGVPMSDGSGADLHRQPLSELLSADEVATAREVLDRGQGRESLQPNRMSWGGQRCHVLVSWRVIRGSDGGVIALWINYRDLTAAQHMHSSTPDPRQIAAAHTKEITRRVTERTADLTAALEKVSRMARIDPLTGLVNRRAFTEHLGMVRSMAERQGKSFAILMCDLDHFKSVNDTWGHAAGDEILVATSQALQKSIRSCDKAARFGGEEFVIMINDATPAIIERVTGRCLQAIRDIVVPEIIPGADFQQTISIGAAIFPSHGSTLDTLLERADQALYKAKKGGRDRAVLCPVPRPDEVEEDGVEDEPLSLGLAMSAGAAPH